MERLSMSQPLKSQVSSWWQTVASEETLNTYQSALQVTWNILRETAKTLWLFLCLGLVFFDWFRDTATGLGRQLRQWFDTLPEPKVEHAWTEVVDWSKTVGQTGTTRLLNQARAQIGVAPVQRAPQPVISSTAAAPKPVAVPEAAPVKPAAAPVSTQVPSAVPPASDPE
jgi:hypothetical protein